MSSSTKLKFSIALWTWELPACLPSSLLPSLLTFLTGTKTTGYSPLRTTHRAKLIPQPQPFLFVVSSLSHWLAAGNPACLQDKLIVMTLSRLILHKKMVSLLMSPVTCPLSCSPITNSCVYIREDGSLKFGCWMAWWFQTQVWNRVDPWWSA